MGIRSTALARWQKCVVTDFKKKEAEALAEVAFRDKARYEDVSHLLGVYAPPWWVLPALHMRESGLDKSGQHFRFDTYLGNGDPLMKHGTPVKSVHVPAGRGPFADWESGAMDALRLDHMNQFVKALDGGADHWDIVTCLLRAEGYNGLGYLHRAMPSPYVWSFTNCYSTGKYTADGVFDAHAVDKQCGVAAMWLMLRENHGVSLNED